MFEDKTLSQILIIIFLLVMGSIRFIPPLIIVLSSLEFFLSNPFPETIYLALSALYIISGVLMILSVKAGSLATIPSIILQFSADCYMSVITLGLSSLQYQFLRYALDLIILAYLIYSLWVKR